MFFEKTGPLWDTLHSLEKRFAAMDTPYVVIGGLALTVYKHNRQTIDIDLVVRNEDFDVLKKDLVANDYKPVSGARRRFRNTQTEVTVDFLISGELAGHRRKNNVVRYPDPSEATVREGIPTVTLERLIELKLVTWRYKDWGDVVELIRQNKLGEEYAEKINPIVRFAYLQCFDQKIEEDRYERES